jgi:hypothetical protein
LAQQVGRGPGKEGAKGIREVLQKEGFHACLERAEAGTERGRRGQEISLEETGRGRREVGRGGS